MKDSCIFRRMFHTYVGGDLKLYDATVTFHCLMTNLCSIVLVPRLEEKYWYINIMHIHFMVMKNTMCVDVQLRNGL